MTDSPGEILARIEAELVKRGMGVSVEAGVLSVEHAGVDVEISAYRIETTDGAGVSDGLAWMLGFGSTVAFNVPRTEDMQHHVATGRHEFVLTIEDDDYIVYRNLAAGDQDEALNRVDLIQSYSMPADAPSTSVYAMLALFIEAVRDQRHHLGIAPQA